MSSLKNTKMPKFKNISGEISRFDYEGKEKIVEPGHSVTLETNDYIEGLVALGYWETNDQEVNDAVANATEEQPLVVEDPKNEKTIKNK